MHLRADDKNSPDRETFEAYSGRWGARRELTHPPVARAVGALVVALTRSVGPAPVAVGLRARVLDSIARQSRWGRYADRIARLFDWPLERAVETLERIEAGQAWGPGLMAGMGMIPASCGGRFPEGVASFVRFEPGVRFPRHAHAAGEVTIVLEGALRDSSGALVARGDELAVGVDAEHHFVVLDQGPCIAAAIAYRGIDLR